MALPVGKPVAFVVIRDHVALVLEGVGASRRPSPVVARQPTCP